MKKNILIFLFLLTGIPAFSQDKNFIDSLLNLLKTEKVDTTKVNLLNEISWEYSYSLPEKCKEYGEKAIKLSEEINFYKGMADAYKNIGNSYKNQSQYNEAIIYYKKAIEIYKKINFNEGIARSLNNIGLIKQEQAYYEDALKIFLEALNYAELSKNQKTISLCLNNIGLVFYSIKDYNRALKYYNKSLAIKKELNDTKGITNCYNNIANVYADEKKYDSAKIYYQFAMDLLEKLNDSQGLIMVNLNIAIIYTEIDSTENALPYLQKSIKLSEESNNASGLCVSYTYMAKALCSQKKITQAEFYANKALDLAKNLNLRSERNELFKIFSDIYAQKKDFEKALDYFRLYKKESDSLLNMKNQELVLEMEAKYQTEKKEKEIEVQNILIEKQNSEIDFQTKTKYLFNSLFILVFTVTILLFRGYRIKNRNNHILLEKNAKIEQQKNEIEKSNKNINSSISYASRIQNSVLPSENALKEFVKDSFILWKPKNIVSGDFYFIKNYNGTLYLSAADCTGHGVPGAFMSMLGITLINEIIRKPNIYSSSQVVEELRKQIKLSLQQTGQQGEQQDGLDIAFCSINLSNLEMSFAGAHNSCLIFRNENEINNKNHQLYILDADHQPVGIYAKERPFTEHKFQLQSNDILYIFSDGYASQFGGSRKEKLKIKPFQQYFSEICHLDLSEQKQILLDKFEKWKGDNEQTDDILVIGVRI